MTAIPSLSSSPIAAFAARRRRAGLAAAGVGFSLAWVAGLAIPVPSVDLGAPGAAVLAALDGHRAASIARSALVHGVAAVALAAVAAGLAAALRSRGERRLASRARALGFGAAGVSLAQLALELLLAGPVATARDAGTAAHLADAVNRLDGVKMLAIAGLALTGALAARRGLRVPGRLGIALAVAIAASAVAYGLLVQSLALTAAVSLPLLLVWTTWTAFALRAEAR